MHKWFWSRFCTRKKIKIHKKSLHEFNRSHITMSKSVYLMFYICLIWDNRLQFRFNWDWIEVCFCVGTMRQKQTAVHSHSASWRPFRCLRVWAAHLRPHCSSKPRYMPCWSLQMMNLVIQSYITPACIFVWRIFHNIHLCKSVFHLREFISHSKPSVPTTRLLSLWPHLQSMWCSLLLWQGIYGPHTVLCFDWRTVNFLKYVLPNMLINPFLSFIRTGLLHWRFTAVLVTLPSRALWWADLFWSRLSVLCAVLWQLSRLVSIFMCSFSTWKQSLPWALSPGRHNVRNLQTNVC